MTKQLQMFTRLWRMLVLLALAWVIALPGYSQTCGLISNSGFENDFTGWTNSGPGAIVTDVHSGSKAARIGTGEGGINSASTFAVTAGQQITFQVWAKISGSPSWAGVGVDFLDASNTELSEINLQVTATTYTLRTATQAVPAGATKARIWTWKSGTSGNLFLDDFCFTVPDTQAPSVPTGLSSASVTQNSFTLNWSASSDNVGVTAYEVFRNGTSLGTTTNRTLPVTGLAASTTYAMTVRARDAAGNWSAQSAALNVTTAAPASCGSITNGGFENGLTGWTNDGSTTTTTDKHSGVNAALTGTGQGGLHYGSAVSALGGQTVAFTVWAKVSGSPSWAGVGIDYLDASGTELSESVIDVTGTAYTQYSVNTTAPAGTARIAVWTWKSGTTGNLFVDDVCLTISGTGNSDTQAPSVPSGLSPASITSSSFTLNWNASTDNVGVTGYEVFRNGTSIGTTTNTTIPVTGLAASTTYAMTVRARDAAGNWSAQSAAQNVTTTSGGGGGGPFTVTVNKSATFQTIDGFGFFGAQDSWWGTSSSIWSDAWGDQVINDLGITIWRTEYYPPSDGVHGQDADWNKQLPVIRGLRDKAAAAGVNLKFIFTVWTPPASMKCLIQNNVRISGTPHPDGTKNGGALDPAKYSTYANYLKQGIQFFKDQSIDLYALSPQNEPFFRQDFNSCKYFPDWYTQMLKSVIPTVKATYPNVKIFGSENMLETEGDEWVQDSDFHRAILNDGTAANNLDILAVHGYSDGVSATSGTALGTLWTRHRTEYAEPMNKRQWMTETSGYVDTWLRSVEDGTEYPGAFALSLDMMSGLNNGNISGWVFWQGSENPGSANIGRFVLMNGSVKGKKYYVSKQFYRYIRPGAVRIGATSTNNNVSVSAFQHNANGTHTIVLINNSTSAQNITVGGANLPGTFTIFRTSSSENCVNAGTYTTGASISLPGQSVVTLQAGGTPLGGSSARMITAPTAGESYGNADEGSKMLRAYPNPVKNEGLTVDFSGMKKGEEVIVNMHDLSGKQLRHYSVKGDMLVIKPEELPGKGLYLLKVNTGFETARIKVLIE